MTTLQERLHTLWELCWLAGLIIVVGLISIAVQGPGQTYRDFRDLLTGNYESDAWGEQ